MDREEQGREEARIEYPGAAIDAASDDKVSQESVDEETRLLNNNPRNDQ